MIDDQNVNNSVDIQQTTVNNLSSRTKSLETFLAIHCMRSFAASFAGELGEGGRSGRRAGGVN
jgi:hypothetical protein